MASELILATLVRSSLALTAALLLVLALRLVTRQAYGPSLAYSLWAIAPAAVGASLLPAYAEFHAAWTPHVGSPLAINKALALFHASPALLRRAPALIVLWGAGASALAALILIAEARFRRLAKLGLAGPAINGVVAPRIVVPRNFETLFTLEERVFIRRHERAHIDAGHPAANAAVAVAQLVFWFNPLVHLAAALMRADQELACDAAVVEFRTHERRAYAETLLKAHAPRRLSPLACGLASHGGKALESRIRWLMKGDVGVRQHLRGTAAIGGVGLCLAVGLWASGPDDVMRNPSAAFAASKDRIVLLSLRTR